MKKLAIIFLVFMIEGLVLWGAGKIYSTRTRDTAYNSQAGAAKKPASTTRY